MKIMTLRKYLRKAKEEDEESEEEPDRPYKDPKDVPAELNDDIRPTIDKIRKLVRIFKHSPKKNDALQDYIMKEAAKIEAAMREAAKKSGMKESHTIQVEKVSTI